jgi:hypothetical protein
MVPASQYQALNDALNTVSVNAQALAAADLALGALGSVRGQFDAFSIDAARRREAGAIGEAWDDVQRYRAPFVGMPGEPVNPSQWDDLRHAIGRAYNVLWVARDVFGDESETAAFAGYIADVATGTVAALPGVISSAVHFASGAATDVVGGVAAGLLPLWPLVAVAVVLAAIAAGVGVKARKAGLL